MNDSRQATDAKQTIVIAGGGLTGCLNALVLQRKFPNFNVIVLDQQSSTPRQDPRGLALALRTQQVLAEYGVWRDDLAKSPAIQHIHVSDANTPGSMTMHAEKAQVAALGYVAMAGLLQEQLSAACAASPVDHRFGTSIVALTALDSGYRLTLNDDSKLDADLLVVSEGGNSLTRQLLGVGMREYPYAQVAVAAQVKFKRPHGGWAYERFTANGPAALLPQKDDEAALVWCMSPEQAEALRAESGAEQLRCAQAVFGPAPGQLQSVQLQAVFPLQLALAERFVGHRFAILGNAAHTLHPVAGQGYNLAVRDILDLATSLNEERFASAEQLNQYQQIRERDYQEIITLTHGLVTVFSSTETLWRHIRSKGLYAMRAFDYLSRPLMRKAMGFRSLM